MNEQIRMNGFHVAGFSLGNVYPRLAHGTTTTSVGIGDVGDLLAYRQMWEPFIAAHLELWRHVNELLESVPEAKKCPEGIFTAAQIQSLNETERAFCASLAISRMYTSSTHPLGIQTQWNTWKGKSSVDILAASDTMLQWHQEVVMRVGGAYKDELVKIARLWAIKVELPEVPEFSVQQEIIARIEGAYISTKGILLIIGYGIGETLVMAGDLTRAVAEGLTETAKAIPEIPRAIANPLAIIGITAVIAVVGGALLVYYIPRRSRERAA